VKHDFRLRDGQSQSGQAYDLAYQGQLASDFSIKQVRDGNGKERIFAGGANGRLYQLETTGADDGNTFDASYLSLVNFGEGQKAIPCFEFVGDSNITVKHARNLDATTVASLVKALVPQGQHDSRYRVSRTSQAVKSPEYVQFDLTSHATTTEPLALSTVPHFPVEMYGRLYAVGVEIHG
jgi:hypothetical protein